jgi:hypothetical protein
VVAAPDAVAPPESSPATPVVAEPAAPASNVVRVEAPAFWRPATVMGVASVGVGAIALGVGIGYGLQAQSLWSRRQGECVADRCSDRGYDLTQQAREAAVRSTASLIIGGTMVAGGTIALILLRPTSKHAMSVAAAPLASGAGLRLSGAF